LEDSDSDCGIGAQRDTHHTDHHELHGAWAFLSHPLKREEDAPNEVHPLLLYQY
jgi:isopentenyldiphosphate isomerase